MGMFDYVKCEVPLPDGWTGELQTKDLCCEMITHTITAEGRLICERITNWEEIPKDQRPYPDAEDWRQVIGSVRRHRIKDDANYHGWLNFYGYEGKHGDGSWKWHEYNAKFTEGNLVEIIVKEDEAPSGELTAHEVGA